MIIYKLHVYIKTACVAQLAKASDSRVVGYGFILVRINKLNLKIIFRSDLI